MCLKIIITEPYHHTFFIPGRVRSTESVSYFTKIFPWQRENKLINSPFAETLGTQNKCSQLVPNY